MRHLGTCISFFSSMGRGFKSLTAKSVFAAMLILFSSASMANDTVDSDNVRIATLESDTTEITTSCSNETAMSSNETAISSNETAISSNETAICPNETAISSDNDGVGDNADCALKIIAAEGHLAAAHADLFHLYDLQTAYLAALDYAKNIFEVDEGANDSSKSGVLVATEVLEGLISIQWPDEDYLEKIAAEVLLAEALANLDGSNTYLEMHQLELYEAYSIVMDIFFDDPYVTPEDNLNVVIEALANLRSSQWPDEDYYLEITLAQNYLAASLHDLIDYQSDLIDYRTDLDNGQWIVDLAQDAEAYFWAAEAGLEAAILALEDLRSIQWPNDGYPYPLEIAVAEVHVITAQAYLEDSYAYQDDFLVALDDADASLAVAEAHVAVLVQELEAAIFHLEDLKSIQWVPATPTGGLVLDFENVTDANAEYPPYNTVVSIGQKLEVDGVTSRNMLVIDNGPGPWWSGVNLVVEYSESNLIGDGSAPITMRVFADQDGNLNLELEADGQASYIMNSFVTAGWNDLSFDVSGADASINWHKVQIRPDALGQVDNTVATKYYIDDIHFANATIVQPPADPSSEAFLAGAVTPSVIDAVSLFSDVYTPSALNTVGITGWSNPNTAGSEITINNDNIIKKFEQTIFAGFDVPTDFSIAGKTTMSVSLYRQASSEFEIKLVDLTDGAGEMIYTIPTAEMPIDQWSIIDIDLSDFTGSVENIDQVVIKPMAGAETFYMDDMYFHGTVAPVETIISIPELAAATQHVYVSESTKSEDGTQETIVIRYNADDTTTTGLGLRIHFDSSVLSASDVTALVGTDLLVNGAVESDDGDLDGDASTDQIISFGWASLFGNWPGSAPADLASITFDVAEGATGSSAINFTSSSNAAGFAFDGQSQILGINSNSVSWDFDQNGQVDALTDGLLFLRYAFNLRGSLLVGDGVVASDSPLTTAEIQSNLEKAEVIMDIDGNGSIGALSDGLLLLRYMFGIPDEMLVNDVIAADATRLTAEDISQYIELYMP